MDIVATQTQLTWRAIGGMVDLVSWAGWFVDVGAQWWVDGVVAVVGVICAQPGCLPIFAGGGHPAVVGYTCIALPLDRPVQHI